MSAASGAAPRIESYETRDAAMGDAASMSTSWRAAEGKNWVYSRASCAIDMTRCLVGLSNGGTDAVVYREFDPVAKRFSTTGSISARPRPKRPISTPTRFCSARISDPER